MRTGLIYEGTPGVRVDNTSITIVGSTSDGVVAAARELVDAGATRLELCGGLGPLPKAEVQAAVGSDVPVGAVMYGFESLEATVDYKRRFERGETLREAFFYGGPAGDRVEHEGTTFVAVPDDDAAAAVAEELAVGGVSLIELYHGLGAGAVKHIHEATGGRVAIGVALHGN